MNAPRHQVTRLATTLAAALAAWAATPQRAAAQQPTGPKLTANLAAVRAALDKYRDPVVAVREGYLSTLGCVDYPKGGGGMGQMSYKPGAMGVHFLNAANIGPKLDSLKPQVLLYEPVGDKLQLVAAEWFVPTAVSKTAPSLFGTKLDGPMEGHAPILPAELTHWDLHVWLWKDNPNGLMHSTNSAVKCPNGPYSFHEEATRMAKPQ